MIVKAGLLIDFGNSETRVLVTVGTRSYRFNCPNHFASLEEGYSVSPRYINKKSTILVLKGVAHANGEIVDREFTKSFLAPSPKKSKATQLVTMLSFNLALGKAISVISSAYNVSVEDIDITFDVGVLLPPLDHERNEETLEKMIRSVDSVRFLSPVSFTKAVKIDKVLVQSEGVSAFLGAFYSETGVSVSDGIVGSKLETGDVLITEYTPNSALMEVDSVNKFSEGYVLVLDIGAGTTDLALFLDMELVESSKDSFDIGGNLVLSIVSKEIRKRFGFLPPNPMDIVLSGYMSEGVKKHDVRDIVYTAKLEYAKEAIASIRSYIDNMNVDLPVVSGLLVVGGGAMGLSSSSEGAIDKYSSSMGDILVDFLRDLAPNLELLDTTGKNLRELNILGLLYVYKYS